MTGVPATYGDPVAHADRRFPTWHFALSMIDDIDVHLIKELQHDGRRSSARIAKDMGIAESTVRHRIRQILSSGAIRIAAMTDPRSLGLARQARMGIRCTGDTTLLAEQLARLPAVSRVMLTTGSFDAVIDVACVDDDALLDLADQELRALPGVLSIEIMVLLKVLKQNGRRVPAHANVGNVEDSRQL